MNLIQGTRVHANRIHLVSLVVSLQSGVAWTWICRCYGCVTFKGTYLWFVVQVAKLGIPVSSNRFAALEDEAQVVADNERQRQHASGKQQQHRVKGKKHEGQQQVGLGM